MTDSPIAPKGTQNFDEAFDRLLGFEGGYTNDPNDPGGETMWGITIGEARRHGYHGPMRSLPRETAKQIYKTDYWDVLGDTVPFLIKFQVFDLEVNGGVSTGIRKLQAAIGVADDGRWGPVSQKALAAMEQNDVVLRFNAQRLRFYTSLSRFKYFGAGWVNRVAGDLEYAAVDN